MTSAESIKAAAHGDNVAAINLLKRDLLAAGSVETNGDTIKNEALAAGWSVPEISFALDSIVRDDGVNLSNIPPLAYLAGIATNTGGFWSGIIEGDQVHPDPLPPVQAPQRSGAGMWIGLGLVAWLLTR